MIAYIIIIGIIGIRCSEVQLEVAILELAATVSHFLLNLRPTFRSVLGGSRRDVHCLVLLLLPHRSPSGRRLGRASGHFGLVFNYSLKLLQFLDLHLGYLLLLPFLQLEDRHWQVHMADQLRHWLDHRHSQRLLQKLANDLKAVHIAAHLRVVPLQERGDVRVELHLRGQHRPLPLALILN
jgi:hypothetical protein